MAKANVVSKLKWWVKPLIIGRAVIAVLLLLITILSIIIFFIYAEVPPNEVILTLLSIYFFVISLAFLFIFRINRLFASIEIYATYMVVKSLWKTHCIEFDAITGFKEGFKKGSYYTLHLYKGDKRIYEIPMSNYSNYEDLKHAISKHIDDLGRNNISSTNHGFLILFIIFGACCSSCFSFLLYSDKISQNSQMTDFIIVIVPILFSFLLWFFLWFVLKDAIKFYWRGGEILE